MQHQQHLELATRKPGLEGKQWFWFVKRIQVKQRGFLGKCFLDRMRIILKIPATAAIRE